MIKADPSQIFLIILNIFFQNNFLKKIVEDCVHNSTCAQKMPILNLRL